MSDSATYDAVIVGGRCAGATLAAQLARGGWQVLMVDRDQPGSDTLSTHLMFPNTLARLEEVGVLARLRRDHELRPVLFRMRLLGREFGGAFTPVAGYDHCVAIRRPALDRALAEEAIAAGAHARYGEQVKSLIGAGSEADPVAGIVLEDGEQIRARWVFGADGRASTVAGSLGLEKVNVLAGDMSMLISYWHRLPATDSATLAIDADSGVSWWPCEDGADLLVTFGPSEHTHGNSVTRERAHMDCLRSFPSLIDFEWIDGAERIGQIQAAPETMLRGFYKQATGPGWVLLGDAGHFKHPGSAQGISDAIEQAIHLAQELTTGDREPGSYARWRDQRAAGFYEWSFTFGRLPREETTGPIADGLKADPDATQDFLDTFTRQVRPADALSRQRLEAWFGAHADGARP